MTVFSDVRAAPGCREGRSPSRRSLLSFGSPVGGAGRPGQAIPSHRRNPVTLVPPSTLPSFGTGSRSSQRSAPDERETGDDDTQERARGRFEAHEGSASLAELSLGRSQLGQTPAADGGYT